MTDHVLHLYFVHCARFTKRRANCDRLWKVLQGSGHWKSVAATFLTDYDHMSDHQELTRDGAWFHPATISTGNAGFDKLLQPLSPEVASNALKHYQAFRLIEASRGEIPLVFEDDVFYREAEVADLLHTALQKIQELPGITFFGIPTKAGEQPFTPFSLQEAGHEQLLACDSYTLTPATAGKFVAMWLPIRFTTPIQLQYISEVCAAKSAVSLPLRVMSPNVFTDGSKLGAMCSTIHPNHICIYNHLFKTCYALLQNPKTTPEELAIIPAQLQRNAFPDNPDFLYLHALYAFRVGELEESQKYFEAAFDAYARDYGVKNNQSTFLINYLRLLKIQHLNQ